MANLTNMHSTAGSAPTLIPGDFRAFHVIFAVSFVALLAIALVAQAAGWQWRSWLPGAEGVKSVTGAVKSAIYTFMSHLL